MSEKHTPGPWHIHDDPNPDFGVAYSIHTQYWRDGTGYHHVVALTNIHSTIDKPTSEANARHIVRCVNAHEGLLAACKELQAAILNAKYTTERCQRALALGTAAIAAAQE